MPEFQNYAIVAIPLLVGAFTRILKFTIYSIKHGLRWDDALMYGHMPSAHTAFVVSIVTTMGYYEGIISSFFALAVFFAVLTIEDSLRLRMYMGDHGRYLNMIINELPIDKKKFPRLKERVGHRLSEVIVGALIGFLGTLALAMFLG
ncbi:MAG: divergent PAP2 family protein [Patescibacteria group bacterium]|nr:divergent PAP2 family protein [Patescibacteria group bacterium]